MLMFFVVDLKQGERDLALKNSKKTYKHQVLKEMRENGELDVMVYGKIKSDMGAVKKQDVVPRTFPSKPEEMRYPESSLKVGNPLYQTSSMGYGNQPQAQDAPNKYFPRPEQFTSTFLGGQFQDTGLNTNLTPHRVHASKDC